jgi:hypothetical protein
LGGTLTITGSTIRGNAGGGGGAGGNGAATQSGANNGGGGGVGGAAAGGAGIETEGGTFSITNSTIASNTAGAGGAGGAGGNGPTVAGAGGAGGAGGFGGGIAASSFTTAALLADTFAGNGVGDGGAGGAGGATNVTTWPAGSPGGRGIGGGVYDVGASLTVQNTLLASNAGGNCEAPLMIDGAHNLSFGDTSCPGSFTTGDPNLGPLANNGGPSQTISLGPNSAAVDQVPPSGAGCPATDQRGVARPGDGKACDIGAYEVAAPAATTLAATKLTNTTATLNGAVTPNAGVAFVAFEYGTSIKYGTPVRVGGVSGVTSVPVVAVIRQLNADTTYHYRVTVATMDGSQTGADKTFKTTSIPSLAKLKLKPSRFSATGKGATISYTDTEAATTTFKILRSTGHHRFKTVRSFTHKDVKGANRVHLRARGLTRGSYRLQATPRFQRMPGAMLTVGFRISR